ncbi:hypothetical protein D3C77_520890 [compost metagenome]
MGIRQLEGKAAHKFANRRVINLMADPIHPLMVHGAVRLQLQLKQKQLLIHHPAPGLLSFIAILGQMNTPNRLPPRHQPVFTQQLGRQNFRDHLPVLPQSLSNRLAHPCLRNFASYGINRLETSAAQRATVGKL